MADCRALICLILFAGSFLALSRAGTRMLDPPSRASLWRYGYNTPRNTFDDKTDCGGYERHYIQNGGNCGVCGDPIDEPTPRRHEGGGEYSPNPTPVRAFESGSYATVVMETSSSLFGKFEFRLCNISSNMETPEQSCFDQNLLPVLESEQGTEYQIGSRQGIHVLNLQLPEGMVCRHCILQWAHKTGFTTNPETCVTCPGGESKCHACKGCGNQVWHVGCTDITIYPKLQSPPDRNTTVAAPKPLPGNASTTSPNAATSSQSACRCPQPDPNDNLINSPKSYTGHFSSSTHLPDTAGVSSNIIGSTSLPQTTKLTSRLKHNSGSLNNRHNSGVVSTQSPQTTSVWARSSDSNTTPHSTVFHYKETYTTSSQGKTQYSTVSKSNTPHTTLSPNNNTHINNQQQITESAKPTTTMPSTTHISKVAPSLNFKTTTTSTSTAGSESGNGNGKGIFCYVTNRRRNPRRNFDLWCRRNCPEKGISTCLYHTCKLALCSRDTSIGNPFDFRNSTSGFPPDIYRKEDTMNKYGAWFFSNGGEYTDTLNRRIIDFSSKYHSSEERSQRNSEVYIPHQQLLQQQPQQLQQHPEPLPNQSPRTGQNFGPLNLYPQQNNRHSYASNTRNNNNDNSNWMPLLPFLFRGFEL
ncbi:hypothetical protein BsWGS_17283 [Bradybaena similaris]